MTTYPEHEKLRERMSERDTVQAFLDWLLGEYRVPSEDRRGIPEDACVHFAFYHGDDDLIPLHTGDLQRAELIAKFLGIDPEKLEDEKVAILEEVRASYEAHEARRAIKETPAEECE